MLRLLIINGPNLNLLGVRQPEIYGARAFEEFLAELRLQFPHIALDYFQSNHEGALIDRLHQIGPDTQGVILNAGALTHYSYALADAVGAIAPPVIEVHISNVYAREPFRRHSVLAPVCRGSIAGLGLDGYRLAILHLSDLAA
ncbi:MAG: type II 3-dehydroquinate dehydratase [Saprospiraceae bacterium]